jgi:hypothetical protein
MDVAKVYASLKEKTYYEDGMLFWKATTGAGYEDDPVGENTVDKNGFRSFKLDGKVQKLHRMVYLYHNGHLPDFCKNFHKFVVTFDDGDRENTRIENLKLITKSEHILNKNMSRGLSNKNVGIRFETKLQRWSAVIKRNGVKYYVGCDFPTQDAAFEAREAKLRELDVRAQCGVKEGVMSRIPRK